MVNQQLLDFIKQQLQKGVDKNIISKQLLANDWTIEDVNEGFRAISKPISTPSTPTPIPNTGSVSMSFNSAQPTIQNTVNSKHSFRNPSWGKALLFILIASIIGGLVFVIVPLLKDSSSQILSSGTIKAVGLLSAFLFIALFIGGIILNLITHILKILGHSIPKALTFSATMQIVGAILFGLSSILLPKEIMSTVISAAMIIVSIWFFYWYYQTTFLRSLAIFAISAVFAGILAVVLTIVGFFVSFSFFSFFISSNNNTPININLSQVDKAKNPIQINISSLSNSSQESSNIANSSDILQAKQGFPSGFPFPEDSQVTKATTDKFMEISAEYLLEYTIKANIEETKTLYENFLKKNNFYTMISLSDDKLSTDVSGQKRDKTKTKLSFNMINIVLKPASDGSIQVTANSRFTNN